MSKMTEEVILAIAKKFVGSTGEGSRFIPQKDYKGYHVVWEAPRPPYYYICGGIHYILVDEKGEARYADYYEACEILAENSTDDDYDDDDYDNGVEYIELPGLCNGKNTLLDKEEDEEDIELPPM